ncbi:vacuolar protein sorting-associated protein 36 isoform X2 [Asparagus officinalis]|uniref:vacuolar protein sorting-associated protein 36 isoform X2 n=1 Tax=Asparagus officinalis TaxID=4686 RepID=UPI00098E7F7A|nr:vacuolar protein sorting-associated protein 36 isoform X2 [Asparagus officinalis]
MDPTAAFLPVVPLTPSGRPIHLPSETYLSTVGPIELTPDENPSLPSLKSQTLILTSHRLLFLSGGASSSSWARSLPLAAVVHAFPPKKSIKSMFSSPKIRIQVLNGSRSEILTIALRGGKGDLDVFFERLWEAMRARVWEVEEKEREAKEEERVSEEVRIRVPVVGVSGILRKEQESWESTDKSLLEAFQDLNALMSKAKEMVMLAEKMRLKLLSGSTSQASAGEEEMGSKQEMQDWMLSIGIISPVTKESAGAMYHQQLSRQLADFVKLPLEKAGGMMAVIDIYCLFNRARGTELISPEDLLQACALWEKIDVPVMLRKFDSGVMVIQNKAHSDEEVFARIKSLAEKPDALRTGISPSDAALTLGIAPALAKEHLLTAETKGLLCRDISPDGFRFYANLFIEFDPKNIYSIREYGLFQAWISATSVSG